MHIPQRPKGRQAGELFPQRRGLTGAGASIRHTTHTLARQRTPIAHPPDHGRSCKMALRAAGLSLGVSRYLAGGSGGWSRLGGAVQQEVQAFCSAGEGGAGGVINNQTLTHTRAQLQAGLGAQAFGVLCHWPRAGWPVLESYARPCCWPQGKSGGRRRMATSRLVERALRSVRRPARVCVGVAAALAPLSLPTCRRLPCKPLLACPWLLRAPRSGPPPASPRSWPVALPSCRPR